MVAGLVWPLLASQDDPQELTGFRVVGVFVQVGLQAALRAGEVARTKLGDGLRQHQVRIQWRVGLSGFRGEGIRRFVVELSRVLTGSGALLGGGGGGGQHDPCQASGQAPGESPTAQRMVHGPPRGENKVAN